MTTALEDLEHRLQTALGGTVLGVGTVISALTIAIVSRGHVLVQGVPGLGKTLLGKSLAAALGGSFKRIQGTADLMPSDITGVHVYDNARSEFVFHEGPLFADVLLVDEINRAGPKTQSALLEAMEERQVSIDRRSYPLPASFFVIATQNPRDFEGTFPLPESQLDRFMLRIDMTYPAVQDEAAILERYGRVAAMATAPGDTAVVTPEAVAAARICADAVHVGTGLVNYVLALAQASRAHPDISLGLSTRAALATVRAARVAAGLRGAEFATPDDVKLVLPWVVPHRLLLSTDAALEGRTDHAVVRHLIEQVPVPR